MSRKPRTKITEGMRDTIKVMIKSGKVGCDIAYEMGVSIGAVSKIRKELKKEGYPDIWHPEPGGVISNWCRGRY